MKFVQQAHAIHTADTTDKFDINHTSKLSGASFLPVVSVVSAAGNCRGPRRHARAPPAGRQPHPKGTGLMLHLIGNKDDNTSANPPTK